MDIDDIKVTKIETKKLVVKDGQQQIEHEVIEYTNDQQQQPTKKNNNRFGKTVFNPPGGLASIKPAKLNYVKHNPKGGITAAMKMPNFVKSRKKAKDGHELIWVDYT